MTSPNFSWLVAKVGALLFVLFLSACGPRPPKVDQIAVDFKLVPFYEDLFSIHRDSLEGQRETLVKKYGTYLDAYSIRVIGSGSPHDSTFVSKMGLFIAYPPNQEVLDTCRARFGDLTSLQQELDQAFRHYHYYFPDALIPDVYLHISGFNQSVVVDSAWVSVSIEKYLGETCPFYEWLNTPVYLRSRMIPEKVTPDVLKAMAMTNFLYNDSVDDLLSQMVYNGMVDYFLTQMMPAFSEELLFDYTHSELEWLKDSEKMMWSSIIEHKHLFSSERLMVQKYVGESPFTFYFGQESPGRTGAYLGYRIVQAYMKKNPQVTLAELMSTRNYHKLFAKASYRP